MSISRNNFCVVAILAVTGMTATMASAAPLDYTDPDFADGQNLTAQQLNNKFNETKAAINANDANKQGAINNTCTADQAIQSVLADGTPTCVTVGVSTGGSGDITAVNTATGSGLKGGAPVGEANLSVDFNTVQQKINNTCAASGQAVASIDPVTGDTVCVSIPAGGGGITGVITPAGSGITGGASTGDASLALDIPVVEGIAVTALQASLGAKQDAITSCPAGQATSEIRPDGSTTCIAIPPPNPFTTGVLSFHPSAFRPDKSGNGSCVYISLPSGAYFSATSTATNCDMFAAVQLPQAVTVKKLSCRLQNDTTIASNLHLILYRRNFDGTKPTDVLGNSISQLAIVTHDTVGTPLGAKTSTDTTIKYAVIDNNIYTYYIWANFPKAKPVGLNLKVVSCLIGYG